MVTETDRNKARSAVVSAYHALDCVTIPFSFLHAFADAAVDAVSTDAEPVATVIAERDALIAAGLKCCSGTPNPNLRPFDLAMSFIDSTNTARKGADMLWQKYKAELDALRAAPPAPSVAVKALEWAYTERTVGTYIARDDRGDMYWINQSFGSDSYYFTTIRRVDGETLYDADDLDAAQAAAQADYEARIRSVLSASKHGDAE